MSEYNPDGITQGDNDPDHPFRRASEEEPGVVGFVCQVCEEWQFIEGAEDISGNLCNDCYNGFCVKCGWRLAQLGCYNSSCEANYFYVRR